MATEITRPECEQCGRMMGRTMLSCRQRRSSRGCPYEIYKYEWYERPQLASELIVFSALFVFFALLSVAVMGLPGLFLTVLASAVVFGSAFVVQSFVYRRRTLVHRMRGDRWHITTLLGRKINSYLISNLQLIDISAPLTELPHFPFSHLALNYTPQMRGWIELDIELILAALCGLAYSQRIQILKSTRLITNTGGIGREYSGDFLLQASKDGLPPQPGEGWLECSILSVLQSAPHALTLYEIIRNIPKIKLSHERWLFDKVSRDASAIVILRPASSISRFLVEPIIGKEQFDEQFSHANKLILMATVNQLKELRSQIDTSIRKRQEEENARSVF